MATEAYPESVAAPPRLKNTLHEPTARLEKTGDAHDVLFVANGLAT